MRLSIRQRIAIRLQIFKENCAGVAAVEFAYLLPLLILMTYGVIEASRAVMMHKRFQRSVAMVGDLVSRKQAIGDTDAQSTDELDGNLKSAEHTMQPYSAASLKMGVTAIQADAANASSTRVAWSFPYNGYPVQACNALKSMPAANMITKGNSAILVEAEYTYKPILSSLVPGFNAAIKWTDTIAHAPRGRCPNYAGNDCKCP